VDEFGGGGGNLGCNRIEHEVQHTQSRTEKKARKLSELTTPPEG
jgi:hypothetical protein